MKKAGRFTAQKEIGGNIPVVGQRQILVDGRDAVVARHVWILKGDALPVQENLAPVRLIDAGRNFDERRLARTVVADERKDFTGQHVEFNVV